MNVVFGSLSIRAETSTTNAVLPPVVNISLLSAENRTVSAWLMWSLRMSSSLSVTGSQTRTDPSWFAQAIILPFGLKVASLTHSVALSMGVPRSLPVWTSQTRAWPSPPAVRTVLPSGEKLALNTDFSWTSSFATFPLWRSQIQAEVPAAVTR